MKDYKWIPKGPVSNTPYKVYVLPNQTIQLSMFEDRTKNITVVPYAQAKKGYYTFQIETTIDRLFNTLKEVYAYKKNNKVKVK